MDFDSQCKPIKTIEEKIQYFKDQGYTEETDFPNDGETLRSHQYRFLYTPNTGQKVRIYYHGGAVKPYR